MNYLTETLDVEEDKLKKEKNVLENSNEIQIVFGKGLGIL